jgi:divalent metal cation (Fe/Co/Zn/Cd) transporter
MQVSDKALYSRAFVLSIFTVFYNIAEGLISMILGYNDETLALFGFGADSFIEVLSGIGISLMIIRIRRNPESPVSQYETTALKITGFSFYLLVIALLTGIVVNIIQKHTPVTTWWGVVISLISIVVMVILMNSKKRVGRMLHSDPILADANCTKVCVYMSMVLLASSLIYEITGFIYADAIGAAGLAYFSWAEGKEAFEKAKGKDDCC